MNLTTYLIEATTYDFCRLSGLKRENYQQILFEYGCNYAEEYCKKYFPIRWKELSEKIIHLTAYWTWWKEIWTLQILELFKICGIKENSNKSYNTKIPLLTQTLHYLKEFHLLYLNNIPQIVLKTLKVKTYESKKLCKISMPLDTKPSGKKYCKKNRPFKQRDSRNKI